MEELLLWRWSTTVQVTSAVVLAVFMAAFGQAVRRPDTRWWAAAFLANLGAMAVVILYWYGAIDLLPTGVPRFIYMASKTAFALCLVAGVFAFRDPRGRQPFTAGRIVLVSAGVGLFGAVFLTGLNELGMGQQGLIAAVLAIGAAGCLHRPLRGLGWLGIGLGLRSILAAGESLAYGLLHFGIEAVPTAWLQRVVAAHSAFDTGAEWLIVLGCVVAVARRSEDDARRTHNELHRANLALIEAVQRDPLTGLANRRALGPLLEVAGRHGATLVFLDLDGFKGINDTLGHDVGDRCLRRFADALRAHFPDVDGLVRYAGDEFVLVDASITSRQLEQCVQALRSDVGVPKGDLPAMAFSLGVHRLADGHHDPVAALREADQAMYRNKAERRARPRVAHG